MPPVLTLRNVVLSHGGAALIDGAGFSLEKSDRACLVGRNGAGKSTLLKIAAGILAFDDGERFVQPGLRVGYLPQEPDVSGFSRAHDYVASGLAVDQQDQDYLVDAALDEVGLAPDAPPAQMSGGEVRKAAIARLFVSAPDVILLDEPTNHLDIAAITWLESKLSAFRGAMIVISHDRAFLRNLTNMCLWLDRGIVRTLNQGFAEFDDWSQQVLDEEEQEFARLNKQIERETHWLHRGVTARRKRNMGRLRRLDDLRAQRRDWISAPEKAALAVDSGERSGTLVVEADDISKSFDTGGDRKTVIQSLSIRILRGDRIGIIGPNGAGKSTLLKLFTGEIAPDSGTIRVGTNLTPAYLDQKRAALSGDKTLWQILCPEGGDQVMVRGTPRHVVGYLKDFLFDERQIRQPVSSLSGGERNRLLLAEALAKPSNLLILDEPTNDLDMDTLDVLQDVLSEYDGTIFLVSHDRDFLDRIVSSTIAFEGDGVVREYPGGYSDYLRQRPAPATDDGAASAAFKKPSATERPKKQGKLSYKDQRALDDLSTRMPALSEEIARLERDLSDPDLFAANPDRFSQIAEQLDAAKTALETAEEQWLELEMKREALAESD